MQDKCLKRANVSFIWGNKLKVIRLNLQNYHDFITLIYPKCIPLKISNIRSTGALFMCIYLEVFMITSLSKTNL